MKNLWIILHSSIVILHSRMGGEWSMESCKEIQEKLLDLVSNNLSDSEIEALKAHLQDCPQCAQEKEAIEQTWNGLSMLEEVDVPSALREEVLGLVYAEADKKGFDTWFRYWFRYAFGTQPKSHSTDATQPKGWWVSLLRSFVPLSLGQTLAAAILGVAMILTYGFILNQRINLSEQDYLTTGRLVVTIVIWSGLFISAFSVLFSGYRTNKINLGFAAAAGIVATGVTMVGAFFCPEATFFQMWDGSRLGAAVERFTGLAGSHFTFGIVYGFLPAILSATALGFRCKGNIARNGLVAAFSFVVLMLPAAYLQCKFLSVWMILMSFSIGALSGALGGIFTGLGISRLGVRWSSA